MLLFLICYLFMSQYHNFQKKIGNDERYINNTLKDNIEMKKILELNEKKKLLDILQSNKTSIIDKINILNVINRDNIPKAINITNGGLLNDWNYEI
jgi:hypothetical protein